MRWAGFSLAIGVQCWMVALAWSAPPYTPGTLMNPADALRAAQCVQTPTLTLCPRNISFVEQLKKTPTLLIRFADGSYLTHTFESQKEADRVFLHIQHWLIPTAPTPPVKVSPGMCR